MSRVSLFDLSNYYHTRIPKMEKPIVISGEPYERGLAHGRQLKETIMAAVLAESQMLRNEIESRVSHFPIDDNLNSLVNKGLDYAKEFALDLLNELKGVADGSECALEDLMVFNYFLDFFDLCFEKPRLSLLPVGCTCFAAADSATRENTVYIGQNYDWCTTTHPPTLLEIKAPSKPNILCFTIPGLLGCAGMNSEGLGIVINKLMPIDSQIGVPYTFVLRKALEQNSIIDAMNVIMQAPRTSGISYLLADKSGEIICLETTAKDLDVVYALDDYMVHTNHYTHPRLSVHDITTRSSNEGDTYVRWSRMSKLMKRNHGVIDLSTLMQFASDHVGYPASVCVHPGTLASIIMDLRTLTLWMAERNPCENEYEKFSL